MTGMTEHTELILDGTKIAWHQDRIRAWEWGERIAPITIDMSLTRACNYGCHFCYAMLQENERQVINQKVIYDFLEDCAEIGVKGISLVSDGESTISPVFVDTVVRGHELGLSMAVGTNGFVLKTPGDIARDGGCYHSYVHDVHARVIWDDSVESIQSGALRAFAAQFPELAGRVHWIGFQRWEHALAQYRPGRQALQDDLEASLEGLHFCGDYVITANMDGAARSGEAAAAKVLASL